MNVLRRIALGILWAFAALGATCAVLWSASLAGLAQPLVVISGSMEPEIMTGDLLIATRVDTAELQPGDVVSLASDLNPHLVTHRIVAIEQTGEQQWAITMRGDANQAEDPLDYVVGSQVWAPTLQLPGVGGLATSLATPQVGIPLLAGLVGLAGLALLSPSPVHRVREAT